MTSISTDRLNAALEGRYRIERVVGAGGMATVFLAHDLRHDRKVALKVLRPELAAVMGAERFLTEIRTTANLQHPHILALFDSGEADGFLYFVMPFVEGETLRDLIDREKQLPVDQAVAITAKVAQALDYAHRHGVVHRDIKPANILLHDGEPVVADFGIALAVQEAGGGRLTETGLSLGTPFYMSPEQATGDRLPDARSDVYSLGSVLYEMLTGEPPFQGTTAQSVLGKILTSTVSPPSEVRRSLPPHVSAVVMKSLERLPADRFSTAGELASSLGDRSFRHGAEAVVVGAATGPGLWRPVAIGSLALALALAALLVSGGEPTPAEPLRLSIPIPESAQLLSPDGGASVQISEDGSTIAYIGLTGDTRQLFVRARGDLQPRPVPNTAEARFFFLSPTGKEIAFLAGNDQTLRAVATESGVVRPVADSVSPASGDWTPEGWIYFQNNRSGISRIREAGGVPEHLTEGGRVTGSQAWIDVLPGGRAALISVWGSTAARDSVATIDLETREIRGLVPGVVGRYARSGHLVYGTSDGRLLAAPFDAGALELTGPALPILEGVRNGASGEAEFSLSVNGSLVYRAGSGGQNYQLVWVDPSGSIERVDSSFVGDIIQPSMSPDGTRVAFVQTTSGRQDLWTKRLDQRNAPPQRLTFESDGDGIRRPDWSHDGRDVYFVADRAETSVLLTRRADGTGETRVLLASDSVVMNEVTASPDGSWLVVRTGNNPFNRDLVGFRMVDGVIDTARVPLVVSTFDELAPAVSPDGRWIAYLSNQSGRADAYVRPFPDTDAGVWRISTEGASEPRWGRDSSELYYKSARRRMVRVSLDFNDGVRPVERQELFDVRGFAEDNAHWQYEVSSEGRMLTVWEEEAERARVVWIENFFTELDRRFASAGGR